MTTTCMTNMSNDINKNEDTKEYSNNININEGKYNSML